MLTRAFNQRAPRGRCRIQTPTAATRTFVNVCVSFNCSVVETLSLISFCSIQKCTDKITMSQHFFLALCRCSISVCMREEPWIRYLYRGCVSMCASVWFIYDIENHAGERTYMKHRCSSIVHPMPRG